MSFSFVVASLVGRAQALRARASILGALGLAGSTAQGTGLVALGGR